MYSVWFCICLYLSEFSLVDMNFHSEGGHPLGLFKPPKALTLGKLHIWGPETVAQGISNRTWTSDLQVSSLVQFIL